MNGVLTLAGGSNLAPLWIFQIGTGLTTDTGSSVAVTGTGAAAAGIYWEVGSQATLGVNTEFQGNILAGSAVVFDVGAQDTCGRAFADTSVTFAGDNPAAQGGRANVVSNTCTQSTSGFNGGVISPGGSVIPGPPVATPEPGTLVLLSSGLFGMVFLTFRKSRVSSL